MVVKIFGAVRSACSQRVLACLLEMGVEYEIVQVEYEIVHVDLQSGEHKQPQFLLLQPIGQVPVIEDGEFRLFESRAIIWYYAAKYAERGPDLLGVTAEERPVVDQWLEVEAHNFNDLVYTLVLQIVILPRMGEQGNLAVVQRCEEKLVKVLDVYEERLGKSKYLGGDAFMLANLSPGIRYLVNEVNMGYLVTKKKNVKAWWETISDRPSWKKLMNIVEHY